jgi:hypothetical protein
MLVEFIMRILSATDFNGAADIRNTLVTASCIGSVFAAITYYLPYLVNKKYQDIKVLGGLSFLSFLLTSSSVTAVWLLSDIDPQVVQPLVERYGYTVFQALLTVIIVYSAVQAALIGLAVLLAYRDIKVIT